jgi:hypothetical protein
MNPRYIIILHADGGIRLQALEGSDEPTLEQLQTLVGGYIEAAPAKHGVLIVNEEGKLCALPINANATAMLRSDIRDIILGDAVLVKQDGERLTGFLLSSAARIADSLREVVPV